MRQKSRYSTLFCFVLIIRSMVFSCGGVKTNSDKYRDFFFPCKDLMVPTIVVFFSNKFLTSATDVKKLSAVTLSPHFLNTYINDITTCSPSHLSDLFSPAPINSRLNVVVRSPAPFGLGRNGCWSSRGSQLPRALPIHFFAMLPPERPQKGSTQHL